MPFSTVGQQNHSYTHESCMSYGFTPISCTTPEQYETSMGQTTNWEKSQMKYDYQSATKITTKNTGSWWPTSEKTTSF
jgi:hypothetical protein